MIEGVGDALPGHLVDDFIEDLGEGGKHDLVGGGSQPVVTDDKRREQSQRRHAALGWLSNGQPLGALYVMRVAIGPVAACMDSYLRVAGPKWEQQQAELAAADSSDPSKPGRTFRAVLLESGHFEGPALQQVLELMSSQRAWEHLPARFRTAALRTRAALLLSRVGTGMQKLKDEHDNYPVKLFSILRAEKEADKVEKTPRCRFDSFTWSLIAPYHRPGGMQDPDLRTQLEGIAHLMEFEMASVESFQAALRRLTHVFSCQTHTEHIMDAGAEWILRRVRGLLDDRLAAGGIAAESSKPSGLAGPTSLAWTKANANRTNC